MPDSVDASEATDSTASEETTSKDSNSIGAGIPYSTMRESENPVLGLPTDPDSRSQSSEGRNSLIAPTNFKGQ